MQTISSCTREWTAITYPQDFSDEGAQLGHETILRLKKLVSIRKENKYSIKSVVLASGMCPNENLFPLQTEPFEILMKRWLVAEGTFSATEIFCGHDLTTWNCLEMTLTMIKVIKEHQLPKNVLVISAGGYIYPRLWITWKLLCRRKPDWNLAFAPEWSGKYSIAHEIFGTLKYLPLAAWHRSRI